MGKSLHASQLGMIRVFFEERHQRIVSPESWHVPFNLCDLLQGTLFGGKVRLNLDVWFRYSRAPARGL
jgi:hypothetical protein